MHRAAAVLVLGTVALLVPPLAAQEEPTRFRFALSPSLHFQGFTRLGGLVGTFDGGLFRPRGAQAAATAQQRRVDVDLGASSGSHAGLAAEWRVVGPIVLRAAAGRQSTSFDVSVRSTRPDGSDARTAEIEDMGQITVWTGSLGFQWRLAGSGASVRPYIGVSAGASHWTIDQLDRAPLRLFVDDPRLARPVEFILPGGEVAAGLDIPLGARLRLRAELSDHVSVNPWKDRPVRMGPTFQGTGSAADWVHTLRAGIGLGFQVF